MSRFLSKRYDGLVPYVPGEQPQDMQYVKLNTNESPYLPSPMVVAALTNEEAEKLRLYSDPESRELTKAIADSLGVKETEVLACNGSDETLAFCFWAFCDQENEMLYPDITYGFYPVYSDIMGLTVHTVPTDESFRINPDDFIGVDKHVIIANPNAPTGIALPASEVERIVKGNPERIVIIDEAYVDFGAESVVPLIKKYDNLVVVQTYSKSRSLAGARLGYAVACEALIEDLRAIKYSFNPYNVNRLTSVVGTAAAKDEAYFKECCQKIQNTRAYTVQELEKLGFTVLPSVSNFLLAKHPKTNGESLYLGLKERGVLVRYFNKPRLKNYVRITIGTDEQMDILLEKIKEILS